MVLLVVPFWNRTGNDQWGTRIIDEYAIHFIHHRVVVFALYHLFRRMHHIITQVVKPEFVVGTIGNIRHVSLTARFAVWLVLVDTIDRQTQPFEDGAIPFGVTTGQVIVDRHDVYPFAGQGIQVGR